MKKILYVASTYGHIENFHLPYIQKFKEMGITVHVAAGGLDPYEEYRETGKFNLPFEKNMFSYKNLACVLKLKKLIKREQYDVISVHTSLAAFFVRVAVMLTRGRKPIVINTVHGYLFDTHTPMLKRSILLLAEKIMTSVTNILLVMNDSDLEIAQKHKLYKEHLAKIRGMGIDAERFSEWDVEEKIRIRGAKGKTFEEDQRMWDVTSEELRRRERAKLGLRDEHVVLIYAGEFSDRKNQKMLIEAMTMLPSNLRLILTGYGKNLHACVDLAAKLGLNGGEENRVFFLGQVENMENYYYMSDICVSASRSEGLPFNIMEGMAMGLPVVASDVKGHRDLIKPKVNGYLYEYDDKLEFANMVMRTIPPRQEGGLKSDASIEMKKVNVKVGKSYRVEKVMSDTVDVVLTVLGQTSNTNAKWKH